MKYSSKKLLAAGWKRQFPDPGRFWVRYYPGTWPGPEGWWQHLALGRLGSVARPGALRGDLAVEAPDDLTYLPPVTRDYREHRNELAARLLDEGTAVLMQLLLGEPVPSLEAVFVFDPLEYLVAEKETAEIGILSELPPDSVIAWPLIAGLTDDREVWRRALGALTAAGVRCVQATRYHLEPAEKRRLAELDGETAFDAVFHGESPSETAFARFASAYGVAPFLSRPSGSDAGIVDRNRSIGAHLSMVAELWSRTEGIESAGQLFFAAARWVDQTSYDVAGLSREGNLGLVDRLDAGSRDLITEFVTTGRSELSERLLADYTTATSE